MQMQVFDGVCKHDRQRYSMQPYSCPLMLDPAGATNETRPAMRMLSLPLLAIAVE